MPEQTEKTSKYKNKKVEHDGMKFDSKKELQYYLELRDMEKSGKIYDLKRQVKFVLQDGFKDQRLKKAVIAITYVADFEYYVTGTNEHIVIDVKASAKFQDPVYKIKKKMFLFRYRELTFKEVY